MTGYFRIVKLIMWIQTSILYLHFTEAKSGASHFISGGRESMAHRWPWMVSIEFYNKAYNVQYHVCGGSLIQPDVVITAAHCLKYGAAKDYVIILGQHDRLMESGKEQKRKVSRIIVHEDYDTTAPGLPNDIALIKLSEPVTINYYVQVVPLARPGQRFLGNPDCWLIGWGKLSASTYTSVVLQEADIPIIDNEQCNSRFRYIKNAAILDTHICVYDKFDHRAACDGDSGGPLVCKEDGKYVLAGVTTWGVGTCKYYPSVFSRVTKYREWIMTTIMKL